MTTQTSKELHGQSVSPIYAKRRYSFLVEIDEPNSSAIERVSRGGTGELVYKAKQNLNEALDAIKPVASTVISELKDGLTTPAAEVRG